MEVLNKVLKILAWVVGIIWFTGFMIAIIYHNDPVVKASVRAITVSVAGVFTDTRELQKELLDETKKELKR